MDINLAIILIVCILVSCGNGLAFVYLASQRR